MDTEYRATGAFPSPKDFRNFKYSPKLDLGVATQLYEGGEVWGPEYIDDQHAVGICTAIALTMKAKRHFKINFSPDFQYLLQKKFYDSKTPLGWAEGSSAYHAILVGYNYGFLPRMEFDKWITEADRKLSYSKYIKKLQAIPDEEIDKLLEIAKEYKVSSFAEVPLSRDTLATATLKSDGLLARFVIDESWWTVNIGDRDKLVNTGYKKSGHIVNDVRFAGTSRRIVNSWGPKWSKDGTAYYLLNEMYPSEAWSVWFGDSPLPDEIEKQKAEKEKLIGQLKKILQQLLVIYRRLTS